jgi:hypothetical protein
MSFGYGTILSILLERLARLRDACSCRQRAVAFSFFQDAFFPI